MVGLFLVLSFLSDDSERAAFVRATLARSASIRSMTSPLFESSSASPKVSETSNVSPASIFASIRVRSSFSVSYTHLTLPTTPYV